MGKERRIEPAAGRRGLPYTAHNTLASVSQGSRDEPQVNVPALASLMIVLTVAMQRPQFRLQPRHL
jgi:hypothetical protein